MEEEEQSNFIDIMSHIFFEESWNDKDSKYSKGELAQLGRRNMLEKVHKDKKKYSRKKKHKDNEL